MEQYYIPKIDPKVFAVPRTTVVQDKVEDISRETKQLPIIVGIKAWPEIQGIELYYQNVPFPRKGFPDADILNALNLVKRDTIGWIQGFANSYLWPEGVMFALKPWIWKIKTIERFLEGYLRKSDYWMEFWYYQPGYYCVFANELYHLIKYFLRDLGFSANTSHRIAFLFCNFMEHDDRFRLPVQDMFNEMDREELLRNPRREINRVVQLFIARESFGSMKTRFGDMAKLVTLSLIHPRVKKAFKKAVRLVDFSKLRFDKGDRYWAMTWGNYDAMGMNQAQRLETLKQYHTEPIPMVKRT